MDETMKKTFSEIIEIFKYIDKSILDKIPEDIINKITLNRNEDYIFKYDETKPLSEQLIKEDTKDLISVLYLEYCCDSNEKERILYKCNQNDKINKEKYNYDNLFNNNVKQKEKEELVVVKQENLISKILKRIKIFFRR